MRFDVVWDIDISHKGDVFFTNYPTGIEPAMPYGVYFIADQHLKDAFPKAELLFEREAYEVTWSPDGVYIAFHALDGGIYLYNTVYRGGASIINPHGDNLAFSPDGKRLALVHKVLHKGCNFRDFTAAATPPLENAGTYSFLPKSRHPLSPPCCQNA